MNEDVRVLVSWFCFDGLAHVGNIALLESDLRSWFIIVACFLDKRTSHNEEELVFQFWVNFAYILSWFEHNFFTLIVIDVVDELLFWENTC